MHSCMDVIMVCAWMHEESDALAHGCYYGPGKDALAHERSSDGMGASGMGCTRTRMPL